MNTDPKTWQVAQKHVDDLKRIPPVFTLAVRSLMTDQYKGNDMLSPASLFLVNRLMRSPTMKAMLYYCALTFHGDKIDNCPYLSSPDLVRLFKPGNLAALIGTSCLYRTLKPKNLPEEGHDGLRALSKELNKLADLGGFVGEAIPSIGSGRAILAMASVPLAHLHFYQLNADKAETYLQCVYVDHEPIDTALENRIWGCTSYELASCLLLKAGFGLPWMNGLMTALTTPHLASSAEGEMTHFSYARYWVDILCRTGAGPTEKIPAIYYPGQKDLYGLLFRATHTIESGTKYAWVDKGKDDISPSITPQLYQEYLVEVADPEEVKDFCTKHINSELLEGISEEDFIDLTTKDSKTDDL